MISQFHDAILESHLNSEKASPFVGLLGAFIRLTMLDMFDGDGAKRAPGDLSGRPKLS